MNDTATATAEARRTDTRHALLRERYGAAWAPQAGAADAAVNDVIATLLAHRSVRAYADRALPADILETIAAAAQSAPTSSNLQAWSVVAVRDTERKARLAACAGNQKHVANAPLLLVFVADLSRLRRVSITEQMPGAGLDYLEALVVAIADAAFAAQNTVVALESLGIGSCYIGGMRNQPEAVAAELGLPPEAFGVFGLTLGYPDPAVATDVKPRLPASLVLHEERYQAETAEARAGYDASMHAFQRGQQMSELNWTSQASRRVRGPEALSGRDRLAAALESLGFGLK